MMARQRLKIILLVIITIIILIGIYILSGFNPTAVLIALLTESIALSLTPLSEWFSNNQSSNKEQTACIFYIYGRGGSGKTTLIKSWLGGDLQPERPTQYFDYYNGEVYSKFETKKRCRVLISDYQGQAPSQITLNASSEFIGLPGKRLVNAVFFIVDIAPRIERDGQILDTEAMIEWLATDTEQKIRRRVGEHREYLVPAILEIVFATVYSRNLLSVKLVINKIDLLREVIYRGYLPNASLSEYEEYVRSLFQPIEGNLREAYEQIKAKNPNNNLQDFSVCFVSAVEGNRVASIFYDVVKRYS